MLKVLMSTPECIKLGIRGCLWVIPIGRDNTIMPFQVANHSERFSLVIFPVHRETEGVHLRLGGQPVVMCSGFKLGVRLVITLMYGNASNAPLNR